MCTHKRVVWTAPFSHRLIGSLNVYVEMKLLKVIFSITLSPFKDLQMYITCCLTIEKLDINICILDLCQYLNSTALLVTPAEPYTEISITANVPAGPVTEIYKYHFSKQWLESH